MNLSDIINLQSPVPSLRAESQFEVEFSPESATIWSWFKPRGTPCFSLALLQDIRTHDDALTINNGLVNHQGKVHQARYYVVGSRVPGIFNLGGDLALFLLLIRSQSREALTRYASLCIDNMYPRIQHYGCPTLTTISLVQGDALGGGFETALTSDIIVAERSAKFGLPEILFNLFPGMGAYSLLARRIGTRQAEQIITSGKLISASELHDLGIVDCIAEDGHGEEAVQGWINANRKRRNGMEAIFRARQNYLPVTRAELDRITDVWVDAAMRLEDRDLKMMERLVRSQVRRTEAGHCEQGRHTTENLPAISA